MDHHKEKIVTIVYNKSHLYVFEDIKNIQQCEDKEILSISACPEVEAATQLLSDNEFIKIIDRTLPSLTSIQFQIDKMLDSFKLTFNDMCKKYHLLVLLESTTDPPPHNKVLNWINQQSSSIRQLNLNYSDAMNDFIIDFIMDSFKNRLDVSINNSSEYLLTTLTNSQNINLLIKVSSIKNEEILKELLKLPFDVNQRDHLGQTAADLALEKQYFDILFILLENNSTFPSQFHTNADVMNHEGIKNIASISKTLHSAIENGDEDDVVEILDQNPGFVYFYDTFNQSAAAKAVNEGEFALFKLLLSKGRCIGPCEDVDDILERLYRNPKRFIRETYSRLAKPSEAHITAILARCVVSHDDQNSAQRHQLIYKLLKDINELTFTKEDGSKEPFGNYLLRLIAAYGNFKIFFDLNHQSVHIDPFARRGTDSLFYFNGYIYIGAKELSNEQTRHKTVESTTHELHHFATLIIFNNKCEPYECDDDVRKKEFGAIIESYADMKHDEPIVELVFNCYRDNSWPAELIVRPPQIIAHYQNNSKKLAELRVKYLALFKYYEDFFIPRLILTLNVLERLEQNDTRMTFDQLTEPLKDIIMQVDIEFQGQSVKLTDIIDKTTTTVLDHLKPSQMITIINNTQKILRIQEIENIKDEQNEVYVTHDLIEYEFDTNEKENLEYNESLGCNVWKQSFIEKALSFEKASGKSIFLLSDAASEGKTTSFKHLCTTIKVKNPNMWVSYVDLKRHLDVYAHYKNSIEWKELATDSTSQECLKLITEILKEILEIESKFDAALFDHLFTNNQVVLLLDGADEISPRFKNFFITLVLRIKKFSENQVWIATRPHLMHDLKEKLQIENVYKFLPWDEKKQTEFIKKLLIYRQVDKDLKILDAIKISLTNQNIANPFMLKKFVEYYLINGNIDESNLYSLYHEIIDGKRMILNTEKGEIANADRENESRMTIWQVHQVYALKVVFECLEIEIIDQKVNLNELSILKKWNKSEKSKWSPEKISRYGLLNIDNWNKQNEKAKFSNQSIAEYFVMRFIADTIEEVIEEKNENSPSYEHDKRVHFMIYILHSLEKYPMIAKFMKGYYLKNPWENPLLKCGSMFLEYIRGEQLRNFIIQQCYNQADDGKIPSIISGLHMLLKKDIKAMKSVLLTDTNLSVFQIYLTKCSSLQTFMKFFYNFQTIFGSQWLYFATDNEENFNYVGISEQQDEKKQLINLLQFFIKSNVSRKDSQKFLIKHFREIFDVSLKNISIINELFEALTHVFGDQREEILEAIKNQIRRSNFYRNPNVLSSEQCLNMKHFWSCLESFFNFRTNLFKDILDNDYKKFTHPLLIAFCYDMSDLLAIYERHFNIQEIIINRLDIFSHQIRNIDSSKVEMFKKFIIKKFDGNQMEKLLQKFFQKSPKEQNSINVNVSRNIHKYSSRGVNVKSLELYQNYFMDLKDEKFPNMKISEIESSKLTEEPESDVSDDEDKEQDMEVEVKNISENGFGSYTKSALDKREKQELNEIIFDHKGRKRGYAERHFCHHYIKDQVFTSYTIYKEVKTRKIVLLIDAVGSGKTMAMKNFENDFNQINPNCVAKYIEISKFLDKLNEYQHFEIAMNNYLGKSYENKKTILLWDGIDEIYPKSHNKIKEILSEASKSPKFVQIIATRHNSGKDFEEMFKVLPYKLVEIEDYGIEELKIEICKAKLINFDLIEQKLEKVLIKLQIPINSPAVLEALIDIIDDIDENMLTSQIILKIIKKILENQLRKGGTVASLCSEYLTNQNLNFSQVHQYYALKNIKGIENIEYLKNHDEKYNMSTFGLISYDADGKLSFINQIFADYYTAEFIKDEIMSKSEENIKDLIAEVNSGTGKYKLVIILLKEMLFNHPMRHLFSIEPKINFIDLTQDQKRKIFDSTVMFQGFEVNFGDLVYHKEDLCKNLSSETLNKMLRGETVSFFEPLKQQPKNILKRTFKLNKKDDEEDDEKSQDDYDYYKEKSRKRDDHDDYGGICGTKSGARQHGSSTETNTSNCTQNQQQPSTSKSGSNNNQSADNSDQQNMGNSSDGNDENDENGNGRNPNINENVQNISIDDEDEEEYKVNEVITFENIEIEAKEKKFILLADVPGCGKTATLCNVYTGYRFKHKAENNIIFVFFIDFSDESTRALCNENLMDILEMPHENIETRLKKLHREFETQYSDPDFKGDIFKIKFKSGHVIFLWDEVELLCPLKYPGKIHSKKDCLLHMLKEIKDRKERNIQWAVSEKKFAAERERFFEVQSYGFVWNIKMFDQIDPNERDDERLQRILKFQRYIVINKDFSSPGIMIKFNESLLEVGTIYGAFRKMYSEFTFQCESWKTLEYLSAKTILNQLDNYNRDLLNLEIMQAPNRRKTDELVKERLIRKISGKTEVIPEYQMYFLAKYFIDNILTFDNNHDDDEEEELSDRKKDEIKLSLMLLFEIAKSKKFEAARELLKNYMLNEERPQMHNYITETLISFKDNFLTSNSSGQIFLWHIFSDKTQIRLMLQADGNNKELITSLDKKLKNYLLHEERIESVS